MAWTEPRVWTTGEVVTAAMLNIDIYDNGLASAVAKVTTAGDLVYATGANALARLGIGMAGQVLAVNSGATAPEWIAAGGPGARVKHASSHTILTATDTYLPFDGEDYDSGSIHDNSTNNSRLTAPIAGKYWVWANLLPEANTPWTCYLFKNRTSAFAGGSWSNVNAVLSMHLGGEIDLSAGDYVEVRATQSGGTSRILSAVGGVSPRFGMRWVAP